MAKVHDLQDKMEPVTSKIFGVSSVAFNYTKQASL